MNCDQVDPCFFCVHIQTISEYVAIQRNSEEKENKNEICIYAMHMQNYFECVAIQRNVGKEKRIKKNNVEMYVCLRTKGFFFFKIKHNENNGPDGGSCYISKKTGRKRKQK